MDNPDKPTTCRAWTLDAATGDRVLGPPVSLDMAEREGWTSKPGSKWKSMPEVMLRYRAASFFGRLYASVILLGMHSTDEALEMEPAPSALESPTSGAAGIERVNALLEGDNAAA